MADTRLAKRDAAAFEALLQPVLPVAYGVAVRLTRNTSDAEDVVQEAALQAFRGFHTFELGTDFKSWYLRILTNCFFARYRKAKRAPQIVELEDPQSSHILWQSLTAGLHGRLADPAAAVLERMDSEQVADAIAALPEEYRIVCALYFVDDLPYQEIADIVGVPLGTVRSRLHRGRRMLQKALWHLAESHGIVAALAAHDG
jgi:RNA polymerase sigma-70 factor (ECF subfamily)